MDGADARAASFPDDADVAGIYQPSRRAESSFVSLSALLAQIVIKVDGAGQARRYFAIWPFGEGTKLRCVERDLYEGPSGGWIALVDDGGSGSYLAAPSVRLQRVPWSLDVRWIAPIFVLSLLLGRLSLLSWPFAALWRRWRKRQWSEDRNDRRHFLVVRVVLLVDTIVVAAIAVLFVMSSDLTIFNTALDPLLLALYALAWLGVFGALPSLWAAIRFWRNGVGSRWSRVHHALMAVSNVMLAWFFLTFHLAGTIIRAR